jgi:V8-like Glu-specific endopeptidase
MRLVRIIVVVLVGLLLGVLRPALGAKWPGWVRLEGAAVQLWARDFGSMSAICSASAVRGPDGKTYLLTAGHCAVQPVIWSVTQDGATFYEAKLVASGWKLRTGAGFIDKIRLGLVVGRPPVSEADADTSGGDWGLLETDLKPKQVLTVSSAKVAVGDRVFLVSYPIGGDRFGSEGIVANPSYAAPGTPWHKYIAADISALPGSSGGAAANEEGEVVGILVAGVGQSRLHLLTPVSLIKWPTK